MPRELVPLHIEGLPADVVAAMLDGIGLHFPDAAWVDDHPFGDGPLVIDLGDRYVRYLENQFDFDFEPDWGPTRPEELVRVTAVDENQQPLL